MQRTAGEYERTPQFESPFRDEDNTPTTKIPSFAKYMSKKPETSNKVFQYFMVGSMGLLTAAGAKATVQGAYQKVEQSIGLAEQTQLVCIGSTVGWG